MRRLARLFALAAIVSSLSRLSCAEPATAPGAEYLVGVAAADITPEHPVRLNGFGFRREESTEVRQRIHAKALAIGSDAERPAVLVTIELLTAPDWLVADLASRLSGRSDVGQERLAMTATHTHSAPMLRGENLTLFGEPIPGEHLEHIAEYTRLLTDRLEQLVVDALADRQPARLSCGVGTVDFAVNRRTPQGPVDHDLPVLAVHAPDGSLRAVYFSYACHCVTLSDNRISGDWAGYAQQAIEQNYPGAIALCSIGCGADANPASGVTGDRDDIARAQGDEIAAEVGRLLSTGLRPVEGPLTTAMNRVELPLQPLPSRELWQQRARQQNAEGYHARMQLARLDRGEMLIDRIEAPVQTWRFGDSLAIVFLPGETVVDYALRLKHEFDGPRLWVNGYANSAAGYIPSERVLAEGGYEGGLAMIYYDIPMPYAPGLEQKIVDAVSHQVGDAFARRTPDPRDLAAMILDEGLSQEEREALIEHNPAIAAELIGCLSEDLEAGDEEYRRIPWIWRLAIASGRRNDAAQIRAILHVALPAEDAPLRDWQAVVVGGGLVNGISQLDGWPGLRIQEVIADDQELAARWTRVMEQAELMADDGRIPTGTRYDALRILGCGTFTSHGGHLQQYLVAGTDAELQMGAVSGLVDIDDQRVSEVLVEALAHLSGTNRDLAIAGLLRNPQRAAALLEAVALSKVMPGELGPEPIRRLRQHADPEVRSAARRLLPE
jgi:hypothetical protein